MAMKEEPRTRSEDADRSGRKKRRQSEDSPAPLNYESNKKNSKRRSHQNKSSLRGVQFKNYTGRKAFSLAESHYEVDEDSLESQTKRPKLTIKCLFDSVLEIDDEESIPDYVPAVEVNIY